MTIHRPTCESHTHALIHQRAADAMQHNGVLILARHCPQTLPVWDLFSQEIIPGHSDKSHLILAACRLEEMAELMALCGYPERQAGLMHPAFRVVHAAALAAGRVCFAQFFAMWDTVERAMYETDDVIVQFVPHEDVLMGTTN